MQQLVAGVYGPASVLVSKPRVQGWTSSLNDSSLTFNDARAMGLPFSDGNGGEDDFFFESVTDGSSVTWPVTAEQKTGVIGFTSILRCSRGRGRCNGAEVSGEVCTPWAPSGTLRGEYTFIATS
ncbi:hypothetical protein B0T17DRAFT_613286 [Bombardia bombarda]|uniref:Uncharacterized protein n=1 Tax=Bombardia bombarda TaxID=252184 RepID=A0AA39XM44_9PEZI|nr:hypothetical protein B0T17DRAFT_613286 [Bombardia bombarda]